MAVSFPGFPWWFWGGGSKEKQPVSNESSLNSLNSSSDDWGVGLRESETVKFQTKIAPAKGKWQGSEQRRMADKECDVVVVPSDGVHLSGYESEGPEWSIGWEEPHGPGFQDDDGFAVLVPCYRPGCKELVEGPNNQLLSAIKNLPNGFSSEGSNSVQQWFSSLQNF